MRCRWMRLARLLLVFVSIAKAVVASPNDVSDRDSTGGVEEQPLAVRGRELAPGTIVGQGRYVLAEKLGDVHHQPHQELPHRHRARLPPPSDSFLLDKPKKIAGQLVPYEGLTRAIALELPQLPQLPSPMPEFLPGVFDFSVSFVRRDPSFQEETWGYRFGQRLGKGSFGEAWRGVSLDGSMREVVLKRLFVERGEHIRLSGEREIYFGSVLQNRPHVARFIESFEQQHGNSGDFKDCSEGSSAEQPPELWLVFHNEGFSLTHHMFRIHPGTMLVELSSFWWTLKRQQPVGGQVIKSLVYQLLQGIAVGHDMNFTHRDIKLSNVFMTDTWPPVVRLGDWGSALSRPPSDEMERLYGPDGPTEADETQGYQPPEVLFDEDLLTRTGSSRSGPWRDAAYDLWSTGVLLLELVLGTFNLFQVDDRRWLRAEHSLRRKGLAASPLELEQARLLQGMLDLCLAPRTAPLDVGVEWFFTPRPTAGGLETGSASALATTGTGTERCSDEAFAAVLRQRDAAGVGLPSAAGRDLVRRLLEWSPDDRISAADALAHSWFDNGAQLPDLRSVIPTAGRPRQIDLEAQDQDAPESGSTTGGAASHFASGWRWASEAEVGCAPGSACNGPTGSGTLISDCPRLQLHVAAQSDIGRRAEMEDRFAVYNLSSPHDPRSAGFLGVFDGHGGSAIAERLQRTLHHHFAADPHFPENVTASLRGAFETFDEMLLRERGKGLGSSAEPALATPTAEESEDPGSTALVCVVAGCHLHLANLGDCRAVVAHRAGLSASENAEGPWPPGARVEIRESPSADLRGQRGIIVEIRSASHRLYVVRLFRDGALRPLRQGSLRLLSELRAKRLTEDHKPGTDTERRRIEELGGDVELPRRPGGLTRIAGIATSRSFGSLRARPFVSTQPDIRKYELDPDRDVFLVLASDGVWDVLDDQLVVDLIWDHLSSVHDSRRALAASLEDAALLIVQSAMDRGALDNLTCLVLLLTWTVPLPLEGSCPAGALAC